MDKDTFIGSAKVLEQSIENGIVSYKLDNGLSMKATLDQFTALIAPEPYDDGEISIRKWRPIIESILQTLLENNAQFLEVGWVLDRVSETVTQRANEATAKLLGVSNREQATLKQFDTILKS